jgi:hypothetical protein
MFFGEPMKFRMCLLIPALWVVVFVVDGPFMMPETL